MRGCQTWHTLVDSEVSVAVHAEWPLICLVVQVDHRYERVSWWVPSWRQLWLHLILIVGEKSSSGLNLGHERFRWLYSCKRLVISTAWDRRKFLRDPASVRILRGRPRRNIQWFYAVETGHNSLRNISMTDFVYEDKLKLASLHFSSLKRLHLRQGVYLLGSGARCRNLLTGLNTMRLFVKLWLTRLI